LSATVFLVPRLTQHCDDVGEQLVVWVGVVHQDGAHYRGGAIENVPRVLPSDVAVRFFPDSWTRPPIFDLIQRRGGIADAEMYRTFNLGVGMVVIVSEADAGACLAALPGATAIGEVVPRRGPAVEIEGVVG
jgi:phosphoribosylformylglycinamidine cyclo-ligase